ISLPPAPPSVPIPANYEIVAQVGSAGMGRVFKAVHKKIGRFVALKMCAPVAGDDPAHRARLLERARAAARLEHPNLVRVFDAGEKDGWLWQAQEFMEGGDLQQLLHR